jgi:hypothetical protein
LGDFFGIGGKSFLPPFFNIQENLPALWPKVYSLHSDYTSLGKHLELRDGRFEILKNLSNDQLTEHLRTAILIFKTVQTGASPNASSDPEVQKYDQWLEEFDAINL